MLTCIIFSRAYQDSGVANYKIIQTVFQHGSTDLYSHPQCLRVLIAFEFCQHFL